MQRTELLSFVAFAVVILLSSFLPSNLLMVLDYLVVRALMIVALLYFMNIGPTAGLFCLMAFAVLFMERNRRKISMAKKKLDQMDVHQPTQAPVEIAYIPQQTVPVAEFDHADPVETEFLPQATTDSADFEPVDASINQKAVLSSIYTHGSASSAQHLYESLGLGHVQGVVTVGEQ
jgi:hypothetical protein